MSYRDTDYVNDELTREVRDEMAALVRNVTEMNGRVDEKLEENFRAMEKKIGLAEMAMKRPGYNIGELSTNGGETEQKNFSLACLLNRSNQEVPFDQPPPQIDALTIDKYKTIFPSFLRRYGGSRDHVLSPESQKALSVGVDPDGGYTVTPYMNTTIIQRMRETDPIRELANVINITSNAFETLVSWDDTGAGWATETSARAETTSPDFHKIRISVNECYANIFATQQILEDSGINVENWIAENVADKFSRLEGECFVLGDGREKPRGFLTYPNGTGFGQIERVNMGAAGTLTADGLYTLKYALGEYYLNRATWLMSRDTLSAILKMKDGAAGYIWQPGLQGGQPFTLLGLPVRLSPSMPSVVADALPIAIADWRAAYTIVDRIGMSVLRDPYSNKPWVGFYCRKRVGSGLTNGTAIKIGCVHV